ncbi:unnamed protein product [Strongylus vulgaris]|uniref:Uncharacterized protein n=1 Tax=Strongylus vulgaris TaxID=40348 RepID=A0A3P7KFC1_STRVU|nr:unnamed protein product [Strongylus vulgaris]
MIKLASARAFHMAIVWDVVIISTVILLYHALTLAAIVMFMEKFAVQLYPFDGAHERFTFVTSPRFMPLIIVVEVSIYEYAPFMVIECSAFLRQIFYPHANIDDEYVGCCDNVTREVCRFHSKTSFYRTRLDTANLTLLLWIYCQLNVHFAG